LIIVLSLFITSLFNLTFWQKFSGIYPLSTNLGFLTASFVLLVCIHSLLFNLIKIKYLFKPLSIVLLFIGTISAYGMDTYGYIIDANFLQNSLETDFKEVYDLLSTKLFLYLTFLTIIPSYIIYKQKIKYFELKKSFYHISLALIMAIMCLVTFSKNYSSFARNHKIVRYYINPIHTIYAIGKYLKNNLNTGGAKELQAIGLDASRTVPVGAKPKLIVLVVCESARASNFSLNGYPKPTNPLLTKRDDLFSFKNVYSCGTETTVSVPCMFSHLPRERFNLAKANENENLLDILKRTGIEILWRDNDSGCKQVCNRVNVDDFNDQKIQPYCNDFECHDEVLLYQLENYIQKQPTDRLIVLHKKGNHGPAYYKRYPKNFEVFQPICTSNELQDCSNEAITNTYDNIIVYTDYFLNELISILEKHNKQYDTAMLYISDHGESLGERGIYLHAMPYFIAPIEQIHIPFIMWFSESFDIDRQHLSQILNKKLSHDNLFHSILGLYAINTNLYDKNLDLFKP
jgi:lipid A ethanolaminephosphotransferase